MQFNIEPSSEIGPVDRNSSAERERILVNRGNETALPIRTPGSIRSEPRFGPAPDGAGPTTSGEV